MIYIYSFDFYPKQLKLMHDPIIDLASWQLKPLPCLIAVANVILYNYCSLMLQHMLEKPKYLQQHKDQKYDIRFT